MKFDHTVMIYFSPTGTSRLILEAAAKGLGEDVPQIIDITDPAVRQKEAPELENALVLMAAPVYAGRIPLDAAAYLKQIRARNCVAVPVVVYGNRDYDDALLELKDIAEEIGCVPVAGGAFIGEHSFCSKEFEIAPNRPDEKDLEEARSFGKRISEILREAQDQESLSAVEVPGNFPYKELKGHGSFQFIEVTDECDDCGICATVCPKNAIDESNGFATRDEDCIYCCACIKECPRDARVMTDNPIKKIAGWLSETCTERKEPEVFF